MDQVEVAGGEGHFAPVLNPSDLNHIFKIFAVFNAFLGLVILPSAVQIREPTEDSAAAMLCRIALFTASGAGSSAACRQWADVATKDLQRWYTVSAGSVWSIDALREVQL